MAGRVLIAGLARNCEDAVLDTLRTIDSWRGLFDSVRCVFVTNDNEDGVETVLRDWLASDGRIGRVINVDGAAMSAPDRLDRLAFARNCYLLHLEALIASGEDIDMVIVVDMDGPNATGPSAAAIQTTLAQAPAGWAGLFPCQDEGYYDIWALRQGRWCPRDCWDAVRRATIWPLRDRTRNAAIARHVWRLQVTIPPTEPPIAVDSAFGGFGIYHASAIAGCWYGARTNPPRATVEHIAFHTAIRSRGGALYIMPTLRNTAPREHLGPLAGRRARPWLAHAHERA